MHWALSQSMHSHCLGRCVVFHCPISCPQLTEFKWTSQCRPSRQSVVLLIFLSSQFLNWLRQIEIYSETRLAMPSVARFSQSPRIISRIVTFEIWRKIPWVSRRTLELDILTQFLNFFIFWYFDLIIIQCSPAQKLWSPKFD